jgi:sec-independent protein translocase protein TatA
MFALFGTLGLPELLIILFIIVLIFGANRLSGLGRGMGQMIRGFKEETSDRDEDERSQKSRG